MISRRNNYPYYLSKDIAMGYQMQILNIVNFSYNIWLDIIVHSLINRLIGVELNFRTHFDIRIFE